MITKGHAISMRYRQELHMAITDTQCQTVRVNGQCKTWKTRPHDFRLPLKVGFRGFTHMDQRNQYIFYVPDECPVCRAKAGK